MLPFKPRMNAASEMEETLKPLNPLQQDQDSDCDSEECQNSARSLEKLKRTQLWFLFATCLLILSNGVWALFVSLSMPAGSSEDVLAVDDLSYSNTPHISKALYWETPYTGDNKSESNKLWADLFPKGQGLISVQNEWAENNNLPPTIHDKHDPTYSVYFVAVFHQLHCLSVVRAALYHYHENKHQSVEWLHMIHCVDSIRQALMCSADDTLLYSNNSQVYGDGQLHVCRDWRALVQWTEERRYNY